MAGKLENKSQLYHQLHVGIKAGLPLHVLANAMILPPDMQTKQAMMLPRLLEKGRPLSSALAYGKLIDAWEAGIMKIGEDAGRLDGVLADLEMFFVTRDQQYKETRSKLTYPAMVFAVAVVTSAIPAFAAHRITAAAFIFGALLKCGVLYAAYKLLIVQFFERSASGPMSPLLIWAATRVHPDHWIRQMFEVAYLNLLILCLGSGIDAVSALRMLQELVPGERQFEQHGVAINQIESRGVTLTQALVGSGIILNGQIAGFLHNSEVSGTLHSDLKQYLARRNTEMHYVFKHKMKTFANWLYVFVMLLSVFMFMQGMGGAKKANPFIATPERIQSPGAAQ